MTPKQIKRRVKLYSDYNNRSEWTFIGEVAGYLHNIAVYIHKSGVKYKIDNVECSRSEAVRQLTKYVNSECSINEFLDD